MGGQPVPGEGDNGREGGSGERAKGQGREWQGQRRGGGTLEEHPRVREHQKDISLGGGSRAVDGERLIK